MLPFSPPYQCLEDQAIESLRQIALGHAAYRNGGSIVTFLIFSRPKLEKLRVVDIGYFLLIVSDHMIYDMTKNYVPCLLDVFIPLIVKEA